MEIENNGISYQLNCSLNTLSYLGEVGEFVKLFTVVFLREERFQIYGFATEIEKKVFLELINISGIGPKTALAILSYLSAEEFLDLVANEDTSKLSKLPGVGKKTSSRLILEFKEKLQRFGQFVESSKETSEVIQEAISALVVLGYTEAKARSAVLEVAKKNNALERVDLVIREALKILNR